MNKEQQSTHLTQEMEELKEEIMNMMSLVSKQFDKSREAILQFDKDLAHEVIFNDKRVDAMELKIDRDCENILALFNPVAIDLRFVLASLKINTHLERIGDNAVGITKYILNVDTPVGKEALKKIRFHEMFDNAASMVDDAMEAFDQEDTRLARKIFKKDRILNDINTQAADITAGLIQKDKQKAAHYIYLLSIIHKLERVGDLSKNLAEELIFYLEAKVLKHKRNKKKNT